MSGNIWGTDGQVSLPQPMHTTDTEMVDFDGFCFTPEGLRVNISRADHEGLLHEGYGPTDLTGDGTDG